MDLSRFGFRSIVGITMPGAILLLSVAYGLWAIGLFSLPERDLGATGATIGSIAFFLVSYALGSILTLRASGKVDRLSAFYASRGGTGRKANRLRVARAKKMFARMSEAEALGLEEFSPTGRSADLSLGKCRRLWADDEFPYPVWSLTRLRLYCPPEVLSFYWKYRDVILAQAGYSPHFFNYCKMVVLAGNGTIPSPMAAEIQEAEGTVRFLVGAFDALTASSAILSGLVLFHCIQPRDRLLLLLLIPLFTVVGVVVSEGRLKPLPNCCESTDATPNQPGAANTVPTQEDVPQWPNVTKKSEYWLSGLWRRLVEKTCGLWRDFENWLNRRSWVLAAFWGTLISASVSFGALWLRAGGSLPGAETNALGAAVLAFAEFFLALGIIWNGRLRTRRLAEVANVMDAFYLVSQEREASKVARGA
jgi:hypothetical protein